MFQSRFRKKQKGALVKHMGIFATLRANVSRHPTNARTYANAFGFIELQCITVYLAAWIFLITRGSKSRDAPSNLRT